MSLPREVLPGRSYLITRRCTQRQFLMRPDKETNEAFVYCLGEAAARYGIQVLFTVAMSNHHHTGIFDPFGNYPAFLEHFHKLFAKCQNVLRGRWENFWATEQTSVVRLIGPEDILEKLIYTITNPVKDRLVERAADWPGVSSYRAMLGNQVMHAQRPKHFFRKTGGMPERVELRLFRPPGFGELNSQRWVELLNRRVAAVESRVRRECRQRGVRPLGVKAIVRQSWGARPKSQQARRKLRPQVAAKNRWRRLEALRQNKVFLLDYRDAFSALRLGIHALFPQGTYWLRRFAGVLQRGDVSPPELVAT